MRTLEEIEARIRACEAELESYEVSKACAEHVGNIDKVEACDSLIDKETKFKVALEWVLEYSLNPHNRG